MMFNFWQCVDQDEVGVFQLSCVICNLNNQFNFLREWIFVIILYMDAELLKKNIISEE